MRAPYVQFGTLWPAFAPTRIERNSGGLHAPPAHAAQKWSPDPLADRRAHCDSPAHPKRGAHKNQKMSISEQLLALDAHMITPAAKKRVQ
jgi:hypothetical protein